MKYPPERNHQKDLSNQDKQRAALCVEWYRALASTEELELLSSSAPGKQNDGGEQKKLVYKLNDLVKARLVAAWTDQGRSAPKSLLKKDKIMNVRVLSDMLKTLAKDAKVKIQAKDLKSFRDAEATRKRKRAEKA